MCWGSQFGARDVWYGMEIETIDDGADGVDRDSQSYTQENLSYAVISKPNHFGG